MGTYYGGVAFGNGQINVIANIIMNDSQQILFAERLWSTNNSCPDISCMGASGASGTGMSALVNSKMLSSWPAMGGYMVDKTGANPGPQPYIGYDSATITTGAWDNGCYSILGYTGEMYRFIFSVNSRNYVSYWFRSGTCTGGTTYNFASDSTDTSQIKHPIVKIAAAINKATGQVPTGATIWSVGLPYYDSNGLSASSITYDASGGQAIYISTFSSDLTTAPVNFCHMRSSTTIECNFGSS